jgi:hypothetical protein
VGSDEMGGLCCCFTMVRAPYSVVTIADGMVFIDAAYILQRLYDNHPRGEEELLIDTMKRLKWSGVPWDEVLSKEV